MNTPHHATDAQIDALWELLHNSTRSVECVTPAGSITPKSSPVVTCCRVPSDPRTVRAFAGLARAVAAKLNS